MHLPVPSDRQYSGEFLENGVVLEERDRERQRRRSKAFLSKLVGKIQSFITVKAIEFSTKPNEDTRDYGYHCSYV